MVEEKRIQTYKEFWPFYLKEHSNPTNRSLHYIGTTISIIALTMAITQLNPWWLLGAAAGGYGFAWVGHFIIEKNRPATFKYPLWSLISDYRMFFCALTGRLRKH